MDTKEVTVFRHTLRHVFRRALDAVLDAILDAMKLLSVDIQCNTTS
jgi:hypothetical protein